ncbi:hypothetical protein QUF80_22550 [Desulfococcaceae bacterium HSG8]|nr:hypothetical protein [Desulfococcaceae bacterium HSG8]
MKSTAPIPVKRIKCAVPRSNFSEEKLTQTADSLLKVGVLINPPIVIVAGMRSYEVIDGYFEYYAAVRAREIDPYKGESVEVFLIDPEEEPGMKEMISEQINLLRNQVAAKNTDTASDGTGAGLRLTTVESRLTNMESRFDSKLNELVGEIQALKADVRPLKEQKAKKVETPLDIFNSMAKKDLSTIMTSAGIRGKVATEILKNIEAERKKGKFESLIDSKKRITKLGEVRMVNMIDAWSRLIEYGQ